jgi:hypothetical protein
MSAPVNTSSFSTDMSATRTTASLASRTSYAYPSVSSGNYFCNSNEAPSAVENTTGLTGKVCNYNYNPLYFTIGSCCKNPNDVRMDRQCTQYCAVEGNLTTFSDCLDDAYRVQMNGTRRTGITLCRDVDKVNGMY